MTDRTLAETLYQQGIDHLTGEGDALEDEDEALRLFEQAAALGSTDAMIALGDQFETEFLTSLQSDEGSAKAAVTHFMKAAAHGNALAYGRLAKHYRAVGHVDNEYKCWSIFFSGLAASEPSDILAPEPSATVADFLRGLPVKDGTDGAAELDIASDLAEEIGNVLLRFKQQSEGALLVVRHVPAFNDDQQRHKDATIRFFQEVLAAEGGAA